MKYLLILIPFTCFGQLWVDDVSPGHSSVKKVGPWMETINPEQGWWTDSIGAYLEYTTTCQQLSIFTEKSPDHGNMHISIDGRISDTVNLKSTQFVANYEVPVWYWWNNNRSHTIRLTRIDKPFTVNYIRRFVNHDPNITIQIKDSIAWDIITKDSVIYKFDTVYQKVPIDSIYTVPVPVDSFYIVPIPVDSFYTVPRPVDSVYYVPIPIDSIYTVPIEIPGDTLCIPCDDVPPPPCEDTGNNKLFIWVIVGLSIMTVLFFVLFIVGRNKKVNLN